MSAYGPAVFIARIDGGELSDAEQQRLVASVTVAATALAIRDDDGAPVSPRHYDYGEYEAKHVGVLIYSSYAYGEMPEEVQHGEDEAWQELGQKIAAAIEAAHPTTYSFKCYAVED
jgi:hypothetical protein